MTIGDSATQHDAGDDLAALLAAGYEVKFAPWPDDMGGGCRADVIGAGTHSHGYGPTPGDALRAVPVWPLGDVDQGDEDVDALKPFCSTCGESIGVFLGHGDDWHHYRGNGTVESPNELYDADHAPEIAWQVEL